MNNTTATIQTGRLIRRLCQEQGRKLFWVGAHLGLSKDSFRRVLAGTRPLSPHEAARLADLLGIPVSMLTEAQPDV